MPMIVNTFGTVLWFRNPHPWLAKFPLAVALLETWGLW